jgi:hypothetical protein
MKSKKYKKISKKKTNKINKKTHILFNINGSADDGFLMYKTL